jgi:phospholipase D1/2
LKQRWNFVRHLKYKHNDRYPVLAFPHVFGDGLDPIVHHPHYEAFKRGKAFMFHSKEPEEGGHPKFGGLKNQVKGPMRVQAVRSSADWSMGILTEHSIQVSLPSFTHQL